jgi:hypothetical protein
MRNSGQLAVALAHNDRVSILLQKRRHSTVASALSSIEHHALRTQFGNPWTLRL